MTESTIPETQLRDSGLVLRSWNPDAESDLVAWLAGVNDPEFNRWNTPNRTIATTQEARESLRRREAERSSGTGVSFCITDRSTSLVLGHVAVNAIAWDMRRAHVGFWLLPAARGRRISARGLALVSRWAFDTLGLHRLELYHAVGNEASCRTADGCAFSYEGTLRDRMFEAGDRGRFRDAHLHARLAADPRPADPAPTADARP